MKGFIAAMLLFASPALAQQQQPLNASDRVAMQIGALVMRIETQTDQIAALQKQLENAKGEARRLKDKYEPDQPKD